MDDITETNCVIDSAVAHVVDNRNDKLVLADLPVDLDDELLAFLRTHVVKSIEHSGIAIFNDRDTNNVSLSCEEIFADPTDIAEHSKVLAERLFLFMKPKTIKPGTLWTILFGSDDSPTRYLALLKMDDLNTYRYRPITKKGKRAINLRKLSHTLPNAKIRLDKAAFVVPEDISDLGYDLRVWDKVLPEEQVAGYFTDFLSFHAPQTNREKTRIFNTEVERWIQQNLAALPPSIDEQDLREVKRTYLNNNAKVRIKDFSVAAFGTKNADLGRSLAKHLRRSGLKDSSFEVEQSEWNKLSSKFAYRLKAGGNTVEIRGEFDEVKAMVEITTPKVNDPHYYARITADTLEEVVQ
jgi:hypothetical protein